jgi:collagenase-like PrtC family protease
MKYLVASNWDPLLIDKIDHPDVASLFGGLPDSIIASGRPSSQIRPVSRSNVKKYIEKVHQKKWTFDFNVNSSCLANQEITRNGFKAIMKDLEGIAQLGADALTITNINLIGIVKRNFPAMKINLSTYQKVTEVTEARRFEDLGVDLIMLSEHINRDFKTLRAIRKAVKCKLALIANVGCIYDCPCSLTHANSSAHSGTKGGNRLLIDPFMPFCFSKRLRSPEEVVKIRWIRPEDVSYYEDIGIDILKILDRTTTTDALAERVRAYCQRSYDGNLLTFLGQMVDLKRSNGRMKELVLKRMLTRPGLKTLRGAKHLKEFFELFTLPIYELMHLDNKQLPDDFIKSFEARDCKSTDCRTCGNCSRIASKSVRIIDESLLTETMQCMEKALENIRDGSILY